MNSIQLLDSLPQPAFDAMQVQKNEAIVAKSLNIEMYTLMERAGKAIFEHIQIHHQNVCNLLIVCGKGNNGGDGYILARLAALANIDVTVLVIAKPEDICGDAKKALATIANASIDLYFSQDFTDACSLIAKFDGDLIIDCIFGVGFKGSLSASFKEIITAVNNHQARVVSVDVPSGLSADTGNADIAISAHDTVTFVAVKKGLLTAQAANYVGKLYLADLGIGGAFIEQVPSNVFIQGEQDMPAIPKRLPTNHKGDIGLVLAVGGNKGMPGAIRLACEASLRAGAALMAVCCHQDNQSMVFNGRPELMLLGDQLELLNSAQATQKAKVLLLGPGLGQDYWAHQHFDWCVGLNKTSVIDADALHLLAENKSFNSKWVLTPHPKEASVLLGCTTTEVEANRFFAVNEIVSRYGGICVLKGAGTLISDGNTTWVNTSGNPGMASGGMGDVLAGIIAALLLQMNDPLDATRLATFIHGRAADIIAQRNGERGMLASDLFPEIQRLVNQI